MHFATFTFIAFTAFGTLRIFSYLPQILRIASDKNGASAISYTTWGLWVGSNASTALYAAVNLQDIYLAAVNGMNTVCCAIVICLTFVKRRSLPAQPSRSVFDPTEIDRVAVARWL
jgi:uncharacterized protein with PQ loop repeat